MDWKQIKDEFASNSYNTFLLYGNTNDRYFDKQSISFTDYLKAQLLPESKFDVILSYDVGNGIQVHRGKEFFMLCPTIARNVADGLTETNKAIPLLTHFFRYAARYTTPQGAKPLRVACIIRDIQYVAPTGSANEIAFIVRDWGQDQLLVNSPLALFLTAENLNDIHPALVRSQYISKHEIALPNAADILNYLQASQLSILQSIDLNQMSLAMQGCSLVNIEVLLKLKQYNNQPILATDLVKLKKQLIEQDAQGLIEFLPPKYSLNDVYGNVALKELFLNDIALMKAGKRALVPMGYLLCGAVGTGKTYIASCLAGTIGIPVIKIKNFRDKWVGSSEGNLEKIFRLIKALGQCIVFIDEADQALGSRNSGNDSGINNRIYQMMAEEMSNRENQGKIIWILATSRPDLIEVDLKRPGRIDVKIPLFPTITKDESWDLIRNLSKQFSIEFDRTQVEDLIPVDLTPGAVTTLLADVAKKCHDGVVSTDILKTRLVNYHPPISLERMDMLTKLAVQEASDISLVPEKYKHMLKD